MTPHAALIPSGRQRPALTGKTDAPPAQGLHLREMHWTDVSALAELEGRLFAADAWSERTWWAELAARPRRAYVVAEPAGTGPRAIAGYAGLDHAGETADVMTVAVAPAYRGRGLGDALVGWLVERARAAGARAMLLEVRADHTAALALYRRHGFGQLSVRPRYYQPGDVDALVLRRLLTDPAASAGPPGPEVTR